jgi:hypothetical protein
LPVRSAQLFLLQPSSCFAKTSYFGRDTIYNDSDI